MSGYDEGGRRYTPPQHSDTNSEYNRKRGGVNGYNPRRNEEQSQRRNKIMRDCFTVILDSETPQYIIDDLVETGLLSELESMGYHLRIGLPENGGLDTSPIRDKFKNHMLMLPWEGFNDTKGAYCTTTDCAKGIYKTNTMSELSDAVLTIAALKVNLLMGESCENPSKFVLIWTIDGAETTRDISKRTGYLSIAIKLANKNNIKVLNLNNSSAWEDVIDVATRLK